MASFVEQLDQAIANTLSDWNIWSTVALTAILGLLSYTLLTTQEPDIHPLILSRQATATFVRNPGESAVYRSPDVPHGFPLRSGLDVKHKTAHPYASGQDGDLRDVWRRVIGEIPAPTKPRFGPQDGQNLGPEPEQKIVTVMGNERVIDHHVASITREIAAIGQAISKQGRSVAIYMPNSVEFLTAVFACAFYGLEATLIPFAHGPEQVGKALTLLKQSGSDILIAPAGSIPLEEVVKEVSSIKQVVWFVEESSRQVDWTEVPKEIGGSVEVDTWHDLCQNSSGTELPDIKTEELKPVTTFWSTTDAAGRALKFTQKNLVAAIAAQINALPIRHRFSAHDLVLPADSLANCYTLCVTLAALFSGSSIALNSAVQPTARLNLVTRGVSPTIVIAGPRMIKQLYTDAKSKSHGLQQKLAYRTRSQALGSGYVSKGPQVLRGSKDLFGLRLGKTPGSIRLFMIPEKAGQIQLSPDVVHALRILTDARVVRALTAADVAGALAQTNMLDYRQDEENFGIPLSSLEIKLVDSAAHKTTDAEARGEICVAGPAIIGGDSKLGVNARIRDDATLALI